MGLKIDLYANDGSPLRIAPPDIYGRGVGGAELAMMSWAETMAQRGHQIRIYNSPPSPAVHDGVEYLPQAAFPRDDVRDVFICYRSPNPHLQHVRARVKIFWSMDQYTIGRYDRDIFPRVDKTVCISPFHVAYHVANYKADPKRIGYIDLGVRLQDYEAEVERIPGRCIFCSVPDRGLGILRAVWPAIRERRPDASLVITGDYRLWGAKNPGDTQYRLDFLYEPTVAYMGKIPRADLVREQMAAVVQSYPCVYNELFCISTAECQVAGAVPVTSQIGALATTNQWGRQLEGNPMAVQFREAFVDAVVEAMENGEREAMQAGARARFDWHNIAEQWEHLIEQGEFLT